MATSEGIPSSIDIEFLELNDNPYIQLMSDGMRRELVYLSSHATNRYFIPNWGSVTVLRNCCAHHSRLWNRYLSNAPQMNASLRGAWVNIDGVDAK